MQIFLLDFSSIPAEALEALWAGLPPVRKQGAPKNECALAAHVLGFYLARHAVLQLGERADAVQWRVAKGGKPYFADSSVQFSLSHSAPLLALAASKNTPVGLDIEKIRPHGAGFAARWFSAEEQALIAKANDRDAALVTLWTKKEAVAKCSGRGLAFAPQAIDTSHTASTLLCVQGARFALSATPAEVLPTPIWVSLQELQP